MSNPTFKLDTQVLTNGTIASEVKRTEDEHVTPIAKWVFDTLDSDVKKALACLGWTPPSPDRGERVTRWDAFSESELLALYHGLCAADDYSGLDEEGQVLWVEIRNELAQRRRETK